MYLKSTYVVETYYKRNKNLSEVNPKKMLAKYE